MIISCCQPCFEYVKQYFFDLVHVKVQQGNLYLCYRGYMMESV